MCLVQVSTNYTTGSASSKFSSAGKGLSADYREVINQSFVLFDDVSKKGFKNLDKLRNHLDDRVPVLLEKSNHFFKNFQRGS
ncbi:hypothetical protein CEXT_275151 [Caerostris extrusa]|uniref:Uncharacterized protein n=1 Tax=Caerostris extrusa TaxID=172846 RepID=A0AAV4NCP6_CAEEX|nr:hypothetical protein CEXT_275151 [Caerostris extrusa]